MNDFISLQRKICKDIFVTILLVIVSIPIWLNLDVSAYEQIAQDYANYDYVQYEFLNNAALTLESYDDLIALQKCETQDILVYNNSNTEDNYTLILKVDKNSQFDASKVKINVNYDIDYLENYFSYEDDYSVNYIIDSDSLVASSQKYVISMWSDSANTEAYNQYINYEFVIV